MKRVLIGAGIFAGALALTDAAVVRYIMKAFGEVHDLD